MKRMAALWMALCLLLTLLPAGTVLAGESDEPASVGSGEDYSYAKELKKFPKDYQTKLKALHKLHPDWVFVAVKNGLDFDTAVAAEAEYNRSVVDGTASEMLKNNTGDDYDPRTGDNTYRDSNYWVNASPNTIAYFLDPRNFLNERFIWQFEALSYTKNITEDVAEAALRGTFMSKENSPKIKYYTKKGKLKTLSLKDSKGKKYYPTYARLIWEAGKKYDISPLYLANKIRMEVGDRSGSVSGTYTTDTGFKYNGQSLNGYYDYYNLYASDSENPVINALAWAAGYPNEKGKPTETTYGRPWTTPAKSILNGADYIYDWYFANGQNTGYFVRFNVTKYAVETGTLYTRQYMTCVYGAALEAVNNYNSYSSLGLVDLPRVFFIPVFDNMPSSTDIPQIKGGKNKAKITGDYTVLYAAPDANSGYLTMIPKGTSVTLIEGEVDRTGLYNSWNWIADPYWFKVKYNGTTGYVSAANLKFGVDKNLKAGSTLQLKLKESVDGTVYYRSSDPAIATVTQKGKVKGVKAGTATICCFSAAGVDVYTVKVGGKDIEAKSIKVSSVKTQTYNGKAIKPKITVKDGKTTLKKNKHYTVSYSSNKWPGTATITIKGKGTYSGTRKVTFKIKGSYQNYTARKEAAYRKGPGASYKEVGTIKKGAAVKVLSGYSKEADGETWVPVKIGSKFYYMAKSLLKKQ